MQGCALIGKKNRGSVTGSRAGCQAETFSRRGHPGWLQALQNRPLGRRERVEGGRVWEPFPDGAGRPQASPASAFGRVHWPFIGSPSLEWALQGKRRPSACGVSAVCSAPSPEPGVRGAEVRCLENSADPHHYNPRARLSVGIGQAASRVGLKATGGLAQVASLSRAEVLSLPRNLQEEAPPAQLVKPIPSPCFTPCG